MQHLLDLSAFALDDDWNTRLPNASMKRKREFAAGRFCATKLLQEHGEFGDVGTAKDRCPLWPDGFVGSISHSDYFAWAAVAQQSDLRSLGIDTESIATIKTVTEVQPRVAEVDELRLLAAAGLTAEAAFTLAFSAKECVYKCVYPLGWHGLVFHDITLCAIDDQRVVARLPQNELAIQTELEVQYALQFDHVFTFCCLSPRPAPVSSVA